MNHRECQTCLQKAVLIVGEYLIKKTCEKVVFYNAFKCYSDGHFKKKISSIVKALSHGLGADIIMCRNL